MDKEQIEVEKRLLNLLTMELDEKFQEYENGLIGEEEVSACNKYKLESEKRLAELLQSPPNS
jgi:hypothetical protein